VRGFCQLAAITNIEVEDDVTATFEYPTGATGVFVTSTAKRLEPTGSKLPAHAQGGPGNNKLTIHPQ